MKEKSLWTILKILDWTKNYFASKGVESPRLDAEILLCAVLKCQRVTLYVDFDRPLTENELALFRQYVSRRAAHEPLAYILGERAFMRHTFKVTPATLVPRPETELLVESLTAVGRAMDKELKILDLGTGSGAILVSLLADLPLAKGVGADISPEALSVAKENAERIGVAERAFFLRSDLFSAIPADKKFDLIVSNPPYIPAADIAALARDVQREPHSALDGGADGLDFYRRITAAAPRFLADGGMLAFEVGIHQSRAVAELCHKAGFKRTAVRCDYASIERMVFAVKEDDEYADVLLAAARRQR